ncbi:unnamed protein product [Effrenium voratum]|uniref:Uncharacterized protein n=1 Tax=Effrenium voratum TaxID=2562239 RepID=A0AA36NBZ7_9DINO|nr:unnamed protein product [Effrenium voratum]CAJ1400399.1 unnamed protein product [Effrenium voratum]CAJ1416684.1 unnamed protein product [Effrenium voratum]CAJ1451298.1 unnamed protein product [Effrenium voratum]
MGGGASLPQCAPETAWLMAMVDCERREKQWLAERYDAKCAEAKVLEQQLASLQLQLAVAPEPLAPVSETHAQEGGALSPASSCSPLSPSLKERRGLKLTLDTASANHRIPVHAPAPSAPSAPVIAVIEANKAEALGADNKKEAPARRQSQPNLGPAPPSLLAKARLHRLSVAGSASNLGSVLGQLQVQADKVSVLDAPASPKRLIASQSWA